MLRFLLLLPFLFIGYLAKAQVITDLLLYNADTDVLIGAITDGQQINLREIGPNINVVARINPRVRTVNSVRFALNDNANFRTESVAPYAL
ncbi:MAG: hypothetical protein AAFN92_03470, partial [Bacteroidota bacterium]